MNLKESFRYQKFLDVLMYGAKSSLENPAHALKTTKSHLRSKSNPEAEDKVEEVDNGEFFKNDDVLDFMQLLIAEKERLTTAIGKAKASCEFDIDAAVESNKYRQLLRQSVNSVLRHTPSAQTGKGYDYKFNVEGNQVQYAYDIEVVTEDAFDRDKAKTDMRRIITEADKISGEVDAAMINTIVDYEPPYDVNDSFNDAISAYLVERATI